MSRYLRLLLILILLCAFQLKVANCWLFYSPVSREQTIDDCKRLQSNNSPFYPSYCNRLLRKEYNVTESIPFNSGGNATSVRPSVTNGWGWGTWGAWEDEACPDVCGRRCQRRVRLCNGPYHLACVGQGRAEEFSDCDALNNAVQASGNGFQRTSTTTANFALYTNRAGDQSSNSSGSDDYNHQRHNNETAAAADRDDLADLMHTNNNKAGMVDTMGYTMGSMFPAMQDRRGGRNFRRRQLLRRKRI